MEFLRKFCETRLLNMDKISRNVWNQPIGEYEPFELEVKVIPKSPSCLVGVTMTLDDIYVERTDKPLKEVLTDYDKLVYFAVQSIYVTAHEAGENKVPITPGMVYAVMTGNREARPAKEEAARISESIEKMCKIWVNIKPNEATQKKNKNAVEIRGMFIAGHKITGELNGNQSTYWLISALPCLYSYADQWNQVRRIPTEKLRSSGRYSIPIGKIKELLIDYIEKAKSKNFSNSGLLMKTVYEQLGYDGKPKHSERIVTRLKKILNDFQDNGYIESYDFEKGPRNALRKLVVTPVM